MFSVASIQTHVAPVGIKMATSPIVECTNATTTKAAQKNPPESATMRFADAYGAQLGHERRSGDGADAERAE